MLNEKLKETLNRIVAMEEFNLRMANYCSASVTDICIAQIENKPVNECGTSFCLAGHLASQDNYPSPFFPKTMEELETANNEWFSDSNFYNPYTLYLLGDMTEEEKDEYTIDTAPEAVEVPMLWSWLFSGDWDDDLIAAKARAQYILDNEKLPSFVLEEMENYFDEVLDQVFDPESINMLSVNDELEYLICDINERDAYRMMVNAYKEKYAGEK